MGEFGGFGLIWSAPGVHEVHTFITKAGRGEKARIMAQAVIDYAAMQGDNMLWTKIPGDQPNVEAFAVGMGMAPCGFAVETFGKSYAVYKMELASCQ